MLVVDRVVTEAEQNVYFSLSANSVFSMGLAISFVANYRQVANTRTECLQYVQYDSS